MNGALAQESVMPEGEQYTGTPGERKYQEVYNDELLVEGTLKDNKREGLWLFHYNGGELEIKGVYSAGVQVGKWEVIKEGQISAKTYYSEGRKDSVFGYYDNMQLAYEYKITTDTTSFCNVYWENGSKKEEMKIINDMIEGEYRAYFENGQLHRKTFFKKDQRYSVLETYGLNGEAIDGGSLIKGNGSYIFFSLTPDSLGKLVRRMKSNYVDGYLDGEQLRYHDNGKISSRKEYKRGWGNGEQEWFDEKGISNFITSVWNLKDTPKPIKYNHDRLYFYANDEMMGSDIIESAKFPGGDKGRTRYIINNVHYPDIAMERGVEGRVLVDFTISSLGAVVSPKVTKHVHSSLDKEALRVIKKMPRWKPAILYGLPLPVRFSFPISFRLS